MNIWTSLHAEWAAMGEVGQAMALAWFGVAVLLACLVAVAVGFRHAPVDPEWATDADHSPQGEDWQKIVEAHLRAEKEQAG